MNIPRFLFRKLSKILSERAYYLIKSLEYKSKPQTLPPNMDYVRYSTLGLCYEEIVSNNIKGSVAQLGVYKGDFSKNLNSLFSDRKLYLFDTFEGFSKNDILIERQSDFSTGNQDFSDTSVEKVLSRMPRPENCIVKKGRFPGTSIGIDDSFCFVSIDTDLYEPILQGLIFFYPRLEKGGYIFIHDFNNKEYKGAREAVLKFCLDQNINYTPIPDICGSVVITK